ncbi:glutamate receptor ionotropic, kainate 2-like [Chelonus insularis]|uniref:glutamate receptor ionotropic, kainate 2-like n=1 Tax=Chelonus insularis TaxID=460826 RepID=UPI00158EEB7B|nr:glutamate receptor ionotropic, kainate 2-like [Chelonus insularis]
MFSDQLSLKMKTMKKYLRKSLFVLLNDSDEDKSLFHDLLVSSLDISRPKWLFFLDNKITMDEFFLKTYIPFNSNCLVSITNSDNSEVITEIYQISKDDRLRKNILAHWNLDNGIQFSKTNLYQRRNNLFGFHFRVSTVLDSPYTFLSNTQNHEIQLDGIIGKVMEHLKKELNFTITYRFTREYGIRLNNGSWTGGIADLVNNVSDIFASSIGMTSSRKEAIDFTIPLFFSDDCFFFKKPIKEDVEWKKFLNIARMKKHGILNRIIKGATKISAQSVRLLLF